MIEAVVIEDSIFCDNRLITIQTKAPKFLDAEIEKHRMISTSSSSDRAVPISQFSESDAFIPQDVRYNEPGMQGYSYVEGQELIDFQTDVRSLLGKVLDFTCWNSEIHKQHLNRYLAPFRYQHKVMTANLDQYNYFLRLRDSADADPAIQELAQKIRAAICASVPRQLNIGDWHLPYLSEIERGHPDARYISAARCARVSFLNHDQTAPDIERDLRLSNKLLDQVHVTPFEHQATPMSFDVDLDSTGITHYDRQKRYWSGNFVGWIQNRQLITRWN